MKPEASRKGSEKKEKPELKAPSGLKVKTTVKVGKMGIIPRRW